MPLTLSGIPLIVPTQKIFDWVKTNVCPKEYLLFSEHGSYPPKNLIGITFPTFRKQFEDRIELNRLKWPVTASRFAFGHFIASKNEVKEIVKEAYYNNTTNPLTLTLDAKEKVDALMWLLPPKPLSGIPEVNGLYLLTLVDQRFYWWYKTTPDFGITTNNNTVSWQSCYDAIVNVLQVNFSNDDIPAAYLYPNIGINQPYEYLPIVFDAIAFNVGQRIICNFDGTVEARNYATSQSRQEANLVQEGRTIKSGGALEVIS